MSRSKSTGVWRLEPADDGSSRVSHPKAKAAVIHSNLIVFPFLIRISARASSRRGKQKGQQGKERQKGLFGLFALLALFAAFFCFYLKTTCKVEELSALTQSFRASAWPFLPALSSSACPSPSRAHPIQRSAADKPLRVRGSW